MDKKYYLTKFFSAFVKAKINITNMDCLHDDPDTETMVKKIFIKQAHQKYIIQITKYVT